MSANFAIAQSNRELTNQSPKRIVEWPASHCENPILTTNFRPLSVALIHMVTRPMPNIPVIWIDGGYNTTATQKFARLLEEKLDLNLHVYRPKPGQQAMSGQSRVPSPGSSSYERFVERIKLEPFRRTLDTWRPDYWVTGIRADQTAYRRSLEVLSKGPQGVVRIAPFLRWTEVDVEGYIYN